MRAFEFLTEKSLEKGDFGPQERKQDRIDMFIKMYWSGTPFHLTGGGGQVVLKRDRATYALLKSIEAYDFKRFPTSFPTTDGRNVTLKELEKTKEFGGDSAVDNPMGKQGLKLKPSDLSISAQQLDPTNKKEKFDVDDPNVLKIALSTGAFYASELPTKIKSDTVLASNSVGLKVIEMSQQISSGLVPDMPSERDFPKTALAAIRDYAGEYLGVQQLIQGTANFPHAADFYSFMDVGPDQMSNLMLYFPKSTNTPLADSLALQNTETGHVLKLSAKGNKEGAPPSMDNLKIPDEIRMKKNKHVANVIKFLDIAQQAQAKDQPFKLIEVLIMIAPESIPDGIKQIFPVSDVEFAQLFATKTDPRLPCPRKFLKLANIKGPQGRPLSGTHYGRVHYQLNKFVLKAINKQNALPAFRKTCLEILGYNFLQIFSRERQGKLFADVLWPGTVNGHVEIYSKSSSADPDHQKISFSVTDKISKNN
jgi:hypothetical protein